ncbi:MAG: AraC family transcriptional regulator [Actinobacteria bacterium]|nr:AraC family transcriptional regulator [Actinomycetota bacterium]
MVIGRRSGRDEFRSDRPEEAGEFFARRFGSAVHIEGIGNGNPLGYVCAGAGSLLMDTLDVPGELGARAEVRGLVGVIRVCRGRVQRDTDSVSERFARGEVYLRSDPNGLARSVMYEPELAVTVLPDRLFSEVAGDRDDPGPIRFLSYQPISPVARRQWSRTDDFARRTLADPVMADAPLVVDSVIRLLAATVPASFPNSLTGRDSRHPLDAHPATLRRAIAFIDAHPDRRIGVGDIARAAYVTPRAVQLAFQRHLNTTPMAYLRRVRLDHTRADLVNHGTDDGVTVTRVAARWGFGSPGRFAEQYRAVYGELPSRTLER